MTNWRLFREACERKSPLILDGVTMPMALRRYYCWRWRPRRGWGTTLLYLADRLNIYGDER